MNYSIHLPAYNTVLNFLSDYSAPDALHREHTYPPLMRLDLLL